MDRNFYDNDFEEFLKQKSDQYKMYPSDRVWNNVYSSLHGRKKWWALGFSLFFIGMGLLVGRHVLMADYNRIVTQLNREPLTLRSTAASSKYFPAISNNTHHAHLATSAVKSASTIQQVSAVTIADGLTGTTTPRSSSITASIPGTKTPQPTAATAAETDLVIENNVLDEGREGLAQKEAAAVPLSLTQLAATEQTAAKLKQNKQAVPAAINNAPVSHHNEIAAGLLKPSRWYLQVYASPTVSYRRLSNYDQQAVNHVPVSTTYAGDVNKYVNHRPAPGFELGTNLQYKLSDNLSDSAHGYCVAGRAAHRRTGAAANWRARSPCQPFVVPRMSRWFRPCGGGD